MLLTCYELDLQERHTPAWRRYVMEGEDTPSSNQHVYYGVDQLGSVRDALDATTGASLAHYDYEPYGAPLGMPTASVTDFRYAGLFYNQWSGLYLANHRAMDPTDGRWESRDPVGETGGVNLYGYAGGDPINATDVAGYWTLQLGLSASFSFFGYEAVTVSVGVAIDTNAGVGVYGSAAGANSAGAGARVGVSVAITTANSISQLQGAGTNQSFAISVPGGVVSADFGQSNGPVKDSLNSYGATIGFGEGAPFGYSTGASDTGLFVISPGFSDDVSSSGPILTLESQASGESAHQTNARGAKPTVPSVGFAPLATAGDRSIAPRGDIRRAINGR